MEKGIKESMEFLDAVQVTGIAVKKVGADKKVDAKDIPHVIELFQKTPVLIEGVKGANEIPAEAKDYSTEELIALGKKVIEVRNAIASA